MKIEGRRILSYVLKERIYNRQSIYLYGEREAIIKQEEKGQRAAKGNGEQDWLGASFSCQINPKEQEGQESAELEPADKKELSGRDLRNLNLQGTDLQGADLSYANLQGVDLREANLTGANLTGANLRYSNLEGANLYRADLFEAVLDYAKIGLANFEEAILVKASLTHVDGNSNARFVKVNATEADFSNSSISGADFRKGSFHKAKFRKSFLCECNMGGDMSEADFRDAELDTVWFDEEYSTFRNADFSGAYIACAYIGILTRFVDAKFIGARIENTFFDLPDFRRANFTDAVLRDCKYFETISRSEGIDTPGVITKGMRVASTPMHQKWKEKFRHETIEQMKEIWSSGSSAPTQTTEERNAERHRRRLEKAEENQSGEEEA